MSKIIGFFKKFHLIISVEETIFVKKTYFQTFYFLKLGPIFVGPKVCQIQQFHLTTVDF